LFAPDGKVLPAAYLTRVFSSRFGIDSTKNGVYLPPEYDKAALIAKAARLKGCKSTDI